MRQTWRWFGPDDPVTLADARQAGVEGIVTALHHVPTGTAWTAEEIARRQNEVAYLPDGRPSGMEWEVVESIPVSEAIKTQTGDWRQHIAAWKQSLEALAAADIHTVCYNFMPVLDWTRTDMAWPLANGGTAMRFDLADFAAFEIYVLKRPGADEDFDDATVAEAAKHFKTFDDARIRELTRTIIAGLPGSAESWTLEDLRGALARYNGVSADRLRQNFVDFLSEVVPVAERLNIGLCCHPDDPPWSLLGLPRVVSTEADYRFYLDAVDSPANGATFCTGSLGARGDNDLPGMARRLGPKIHFVHLRNVKRTGKGAPVSFFEAAHLAGDNDMVAIVRALLDEEARRRKTGHRVPELPMRPDHGQAILDDLQRGARPGYTAIGRLKGLAELRGIVAALTYPEPVN